MWMSPLVLFSSILTFPLQYFVFSGVFFFLKFSDLLNSLIHAKVDVQIEA